MQKYQLSRKNLPADVLVLKEIARRVISAKQYKFLLKHRLVIRKMGWIYGGKYYRMDWQYCGRNPSIHMNPNRYQSLIQDSAIRTWLHELAHMVFHNSKAIRNDGNHHRKTFWKLLQRLDKNYENKTKPELDQIIENCKSKEAGFRSMASAHKEALAEAKTHKNSLEYKLQRTHEAIGRWETKRKRADSWLKKLYRRQKIYQTLIQKQNL